MSLLGIYFYLFISFLTLLNQNFCYGFAFSCFWLYLVSLIPSLLCLNPPFLDFPSKLMVQLNIKTALRERFTDFPKCLAICVIIGTGKAAMPHWALMNESLNWKFTFDQELILCIFFFKRFLLHQPWWILSSFFFFYFYFYFLKSFISVLKSS